MDSSGVDVLDESPESVRGSVGHGEGTVVKSG